MRKKIGYSLFLGVVVGLVVSLYIYNGESLYYNDIEWYKGGIMYKTHPNLEVIFGSFKVVAASFVSILTVWYLSSKYTTKSARV